MRLKRARLGPRDEGAAPHASDSWLNQTAGTSYLNMARLMFASSFRAGMMMKRRGDPIRGMKDCIPLSFFLSRHTRPVLHTEQATLANTRTHTRTFHMLRASALASRLAPPRPRPPFASASAQRSPFPTRSVIAAATANSPPRVLVPIADGSEEMEVF